MAKKSKTPPVNAKKAWKKSAAYKTGTGGSDYAKKRDGKIARNTTSTFGDASGYGGSSYSEPSYGYGEPMVHYVPRFDSTPQPTYTEGFYETEAFLGGGANALDILGAHFDPVENENLKYKPCFLTVEHARGDDKAIITRYIGYVHRGEFSGQKESQTVEPFYHSRFSIKWDLQDWCGRQSERASQGRLHPKAEPVSRGESRSSIGYGRRFNW